MKECIGTFLKIIEFPHMCKWKKFRTLQPNEGQFEMNGPLYGNNDELTGQVQLAIQCKKCGYGKGINISLADALEIRKYCILNDMYSRNAFRKLDCYLCKEKKVPQEQCIFYVKGLLGACKGYRTERDDAEKVTANKIFS